jgi:hypothetical protein
VCVSNANLRFLIDAFVLGVAVRPELSLAEGGSVDDLAKLGFFVSTAVDVVPPSAECGAAMRVPRPRSRADFEELMSTIGRSGRAPRVTAPLVAAPLVTAPRDPEVVRIRDLEPGQITAAATTAGPVAFWQPEFPMLALPALLADRVCDRSITPAFRSQVERLVFPGAGASAKPVAFEAAMPLAVEMRPTAGAPSREVESADERSKRADDPSVAAQGPAWRALEVRSANGLALRLNALLRMNQKRFPLKWVLPGAVWCPQELGERMFSMPTGDEFEFVVREDAQPWMAFKKSVLVAQQVDMAPGVYLCTRGCPCFDGRVVFDDVCVGLQMKGEGFEPADLEKVERGAAAYAIAGVGPPLVAAYLVRSSRKSFEFPMPVAPVAGGSPSVAAASPESKTRRPPVEILGCAVYGGTWVDDLFPGNAALYEKWVWSTARQRFVRETRE